MSINPTINSNNVGVLPNYSDAEAPKNSDRLEKIKRIALASLTVFTIAVGAAACLGAAVLVLVVCLPKPVAIMLHILILSTLPLFMPEVFDKIL